MNLTPTDTQPNDQGGRRPRRGGVCTGKIGRLPYVVREEINLRLLNGEPASVILPWLNADPRVRVVLARDFAGRAVNDDNLSQWRMNGHAKWLKENEPLIRRMKAINRVLEAIKGSVVRAS